MSPLNGKTFVLELNREIRFKAKQELINYLREQNAQISYILTASTDYVLVSNDIDTYKTRRAKQLGIPLVNVEYIYECRNISSEKNPVDIKQFIVTSAEDKENFSKSGTIPVSGGGSSSISTIKPVKFDLSKIKIWNYDDVELPKFDELINAEIGKWAIFKETNENSDVYFALELQIIPEERYNQINNNYRSRFRYEKQTITSLKGKISLIQYAFSNDINELHQLFSSYYNRIVTMPRITRIKDLLPDKLGSKLLLRSLFLNRIDTQMLDDNICQLIESLWIESIGDLNKILSVQPESIALKTIIEAEAALLEIKSDSKSSSEAETRFYSLIPHRQSFIVDLLNNRRALIDKIDLCQMLRDMLTVNELTNWNIKASIEAKYRALKCHIETVENDTHEYTTVCDMISSSTNSNEKVIVHQIYSVAKQTDALNFRSTLFNQKQLFHGSKFNNFLGILSRGLVMPKMVVNDLGITRTDIGCLGYGIYFSDSVSTSLKYTTSSTTRPGRRLLCISQVALGESAKFYSYSPNLIQPPENFHSTHGVKKTNENNSKFVDDEFAIYNLDQQRLIYIVELSWIPYDDINQSFKFLPIIRDQLTNRLNEISVDIPSIIEDEDIQVAEQDYGLICPSSGQLVPLKAFHIRAQLVDITAEVVLYQVYHNTSSIPIEAKYVFPLDENCSVCGFEAHINNKIIKGVVKEKEQAKREYREAIEKGHGAYLMHQEQPEVFSVSVGNLPANCEVIIKITYVAELPIENNDIIFRLPAKVASWQSKQALEMKDQTILPSINLNQENSSMKSVEFSLKTSIRMPYEIIKLFSPTHRLRRKMTDCMAMIELVDNILLEKDFILSITLKSVNLPRMLNETYDLSNENSQSCMLTFYPKFEIINNLNEYIEIIFIIDVSNSMDGNHIQQAKQLTHLFLTNMKSENGNIYFNIVTFGSDNDECFPISLPNTKENIDKAKHFVLHSLDHRGNTDLFSVLRQYSLFPSSSKLGRQFILLSDGHINDLNSILTLLKNQSSMRYDRLFTCSIGDISNKHNLKQLSNQANGGGLTTIFDSNYRSRWKTKVLQILEHIHQPCVTNISIDWHGTIDNQKEIFTNQAPKIIRSLFNGMRLTVYRFIQNCHKATLTARINNQEFITSVFSNKITETKGRILHCLTARAIIQDYENGLLDNDESENELIKKQYKQDLIDLSIKYSVVSSFTSFVAIEERDGEALEPGVRVLDVMLEHDIDLLPYIGWDGDRSQIDLIKEKLINAKRLFDSASISNKIQLTNEYENLCKNISYRSGGDAKYDLMLTIIDTYRTILKEKEKTRELEEKMRDDLINEINNATADERKILEKRLDEINTRFEIKDVENFEEDDDGWLDEIDKMDDSDFDGISGGDLEMDELCINVPIKCSLFDELPGFAGETDDEEEECETSLLERSDDRKEAKQVDAEESDRDLGFNLFGDYKDMGLQTAGLKLEACAAAPKAEAKTYSLDSDEEGDDMGYGLFDDDEPVSFSTTSFKHEKKPIHEAEKLPEKASQQISDAPLLTNLDLSLKKVQLMHTLQSGQKLSQAVPNDTSSSDSSDDALFMPLIYSSIPRAKFIPLKTQSTIFPPQFQQQQQQKHHQTMCLPSYVPSAPAYAPTSPSNLFDITNESSVLTLNASQFAMQQPNVYSSAHVPRPQRFSVPTTISNTASLFSGFGGLSPSASAAPIPPPPPPGALFSFDPYGSNVTNNNIPASSTCAGFDSSSAFAFGAPPTMLLPSAQSSLFSVTASGSSITNNNNIAPSMSTGFGGSSTFPSAAPPAPPSFSNSAVFASNSSSKNNVFDMHAAPPVFHTQQMYMPSVFQHPPPPPPTTTSFSNSALFGSSNSNNNNVFSMQAAPPVFGTQQIYMPPAFQPPPPPPPPLFDSKSFSPRYQPFSFGTSSTSTTTNVAPQATVNTSMPEIPTALPGASILSSNRSGFLSKEPTISTMARQVSPDSLSSMNDKFAVSDARHEAEESKMIVVRQDSDNNGRDRIRSEESNRGGGGGRGGRGGKGAFVAGKNSLKLKTVFDFVEREGTSENVPEARSESLMQSTRYCDTRSDEQVVSSSSASTLELSIDNDHDDWSSKTSALRKKKISKLGKPASSSKFTVQDLLLLDVTPLGIGVEDINGHMCTIISRNRTIPLKTQFYPIFTNAYAHQTTATIRVFQGEHKLTKYNTFIGEFNLTGLTSNFASQVLEISVRMNIDANGLLEVEAEESRSGAKVKITIDTKNHPLSRNDIERHVEYVESDPDCRARCVTDRKLNDSLYMLKGETDNAKISFTGDIEISKDFSGFEKNENIQLTSTIINELKRIQLTDGSFDLNQDLANLLSIDINTFEELKKYLCKQGFNSFALNIQNEIIHLIATGIILIELLYQVPMSEIKTFIVPFNHEQIRSTFHLHLPRILVENANKAIDFYEQKRLRYGIYCEQLELRYSSWEKFIQYSLFHINN